ncbi:alpha/beta hydrolase [Nocardioides sp. JQ2195]|uniref:esterase/lipase family protein n=1 Tax=Nocardioides sp. JQ2195 TaxID=2592334 RepID=UPI00143E53D5|nr:alpha/beta hydrolase [Nocardioides sp. JQ2195]QIX26066.1 alpha/beta hydrolase [Nocardioides sp. JQ2195]
MNTISGPGVVDALGLLPVYGDEILLRTVRDTHRAWAGRTYGVLNRVTGNRARGPQLLHDGISSAVYGSIGAGLTLTSHALRAAGAAGVGPRLEHSARGRFVRSALNGLVGDRFAHEGSRLAITTTVRDHGRDVPLEPDRLAAVFPAAGEKVAVLLHGLSENESFWDLHGDAVGTTYAATLVELGWTPVLLRLNTGRSVRENGVDVAALMRDLVAGWPVEPSRVALIGHSMGGLVARAACAVDLGDEDPWTRLVSDVVTLGSPHAGAPLAIAVGHGSRLLAHLPETSAFGRILDHRSVGIEDLVDGLGHDVTPLPTARYRLVAATLTESARHPLGHLMGDLLVRVPSAHGRSRRQPDLFPDADVLHVPRSDHFGLLNHPDVHTALRSWLR